MKKAYILPPLLLVAFCCAAGANEKANKPAGDADKPSDEYVFKLFSGGEIRGKFLNVNQRPYRRYVIQTPAGGKITLPKDEVEEVIRKPAREVEYERIRPTYPDTVKGHMDLAEWCRKNYLSAQQRAHLHRVIELDPEHAQARRLLGFRKIENRWYTRKEYMEDVVGKVYVPGSGWLLPQEIKLREERRNRDVRERTWFRDVKRLRSQYNKPKTRQKSVKGFLNIRDGFAVKAIAYYKEPKREKSTAVRILLTQVLGNIGTPAAINLLIGSSLYDPNEDVRYEAMQELAERKPHAAVTRFVKHLGDGDNKIINRAAIGLYYMEDRTAIRPLIEALVSTHVTVYREGGGTKATFPLNPGGGGFTPGGMRSGVSYKTVKRTYRNYKVLDALRKLSGMDFTFNVSQWKSWYATVKKTDKVDLRRDSK